MPIYYAVYTFISEPETYWWPLNREVRIQFADSLLWANLIGYIIPTTLMFVPWKDPFTIQNVEAFWQISPMLVPLICSTLGHFYAKRNNLKQTQRKAKQTFPDLAPLKRLYMITGTLGLLLHVYCLGKIASSSKITFKSVFWPDFSTQAKPFGEGLRQVFLADFWGFYAATYGWLCMAIWDLKRMGRTRVNIRKVSALIALSSFVIGPGATMSVVWYWREITLSKTTFTTGGLT